MNISLLGQGTQTQQGHWKIPRWHFTALEGGSQRKVFPVGAHRQKRAESTVHSCCLPSLVETTSDLVDCSHLTSRYPISKLYSLSDINLQMLGRSWWFQRVMDSLKQESPFLCSALSHEYYWKLISGLNIIISFIDRQLQ